MAARSSVVVLLVLVTCSIFSSIQAGWDPNELSSEKKLSAPPTRAGAPKKCSQSSVDRTSLGSFFDADNDSTIFRFQPRGVGVKGFYQWENNNGYCGEVSLIQSAMGFGIWISQLNMRAIASPFPVDISQTGKRREGKIDFLSQMLLDDYSPPFNMSTDSFGRAADYLGLRAVSYPSKIQAVGRAGFRDFILWIKRHVVAGDYVTVGVKVFADYFLNFSCYIYIYLYYYYNYN